jgi:hypothetical protein
LKLRFLICSFEFAQRARIKYFIRDFSSTKRYFLCSKYIFVFWNFIWHSRFLGENGQRAGDTSTGVLSLALTLFQLNILFRDRGKLDCSNCVHVCIFATLLWNDYVMEKGYNENVDQCRRKKRAKILPPPARFRCIYSRFGVFKSFVAGNLVSSIKKVCLFDVVDDAEHVLYLSQSCNRTF